MNNYEYVPVKVLVPDENPNLPRGFTKVVTRYIKVAVEPKTFNIDDEDIVI